MFCSQDGWAVDLQDEPHIWTREEAAQPAQGPMADPETDGCESDEGPGRSQDPAGVQQKSGQAGGMDEREGKKNILFFFCCYAKC